MSKIPPEKYYEACITYNLVNEFDLQFDIKLYPFSVSQIEENDLGYDFGYEFSAKSFFIQYKKPFLHDVESKLTTWQIDISQLSTIISNDIGIRTYYALPYFTSTMSWYEGLQNTYFVDSIRLHNSLKDKLKQNTVNIKSINNYLREWDYFFNSNMKSLSNLALKSDLVDNNNLNDIVDYVKRLDYDEKENLWLYLLKKE